MPEDPFHGEEWKTIVEHYVGGGVAEALYTSHFGAVLADAKHLTSPDIQQALELGLMVLWDKPIILIVDPDTQLPRKLEIVVDKIIRVDITKPGADRVVSEKIKEFMDTFEEDNSGH